MSRQLLKRVELLGFKSFADRTVLEFGPRVSALVGPNGCGKSNIVDAIRWALGEQAPRSLRAERMEDVIFDGAGSRRSMSVSEVTLVFSNEDERLPIASAEVGVKRRLYRSGESQYFVNGTQSRLRDVRELLADTGLATSGYASLEQGKIDRVLSDKPEERRAVFEEAAGILSYRTRAVEAERELKQAAANVAQVENVRREVQRRQETLRVQAQAAERYRSLRAQAFEVERDLELLRLRALRERRQRIQSRLSRETETRDKVQREIDTAAASTREHRAEIERLEGERATSQERLYELATAMSGAGSEIRLGRERVDELEASMHSYQSRDHALADRIRSLETEAETVRTGLAAAERGAADAERKAADARGDAAAVGAKISETERLIADASVQTASHEQRLDGLRDRLRKVTDEIVTELDQRLGQGMQSTPSAALGNEVAESLARLHHDIGRLAASATGIAKEELARRLGELVEMAEGLMERFARYRETTGSLLEELISSEGIVTHKRAIDRDMGETFWAIAELRKQTEELRRSNRERADRLGELRDAVQESQVAAARAQEQAASLRRQLVASQRQLDEQRQIRADLAAEEHQTAEAIRALASSTSDREREKVLLDREHERLQKDLGRRSAQVATHRRELDRIDQAAQQRLLRLRQAQETLERVRVELAEVEAEDKAIRHTFAHTHSQRLEEHSERLERIEATPRELRDRLGRLRERIRGLGQVNLLAPEEFKEVAERFQFLTDQLEDLSQARTDLERVTAEIQRESAERFDVSFQAIADAFRDIFRRLFGGGRAELRLRGQEVLEAGVDIRAQPPGRKLGNVGLLSGGERSLTAVALMFAMYSVKPSPFCVLDELDAALDDENIGRFVGLMEEFAHDSQFLIVTHNKRTIAAATNLYGVTMEEPGISKLVTLRLPERAEPEPVPA
jgi:chromosome segregation protein